LHFPALYNFIVDLFEDQEDEEDEEVIEDLLTWWNKYVHVQRLRSLLMISHRFRKIFPPATAGKMSTKESRKAKLESRQRIREARARHARTRAERNPEESVTEDDSGAETVAR
jgi:hypothetical protein